MNKIKATFVYLTRADKRTFLQLFKSLIYLHFSFNSNYKYPITIFHESNYPSYYKYFFNFFFKNVNFKLVNLETPSFYNYIQFEDDFKYLGYGYRNMCRFFNSEFYKYLEEFDWYCRLDTDSYLLNKIRFDFFEEMIKNGHKYGYIGEVLEAPGAIKEITPFIINFLKNYNIKLGNNFKLFNSEFYYNNRMIYTNFEIIDLRIFRDDRIKSYLDEINITGNIYRYRWGDAPLRTFLISIFLEKNQIVRFDNIDYKHLPFIQKKGVISSPYTPDSWIEKQDWIGINYTNYE